MEDHYSPKWKNADDSIKQVGSISPVIAVLLMQILIEIKNRILVQRRKTPNRMQDTTQH